MTIPLKPVGVPSTLRTTNTPPSCAGIVAPVKEKPRATLPEAFTKNPAEVAAPPEPLKIVAPSKLN